MDNCYICLEKTSIYFISKECDCKIYCHEECLKQILKLENCILCKKNINNLSLKIEEKIEEKIFILKILKKLHDNKLINNILKMESCFDLLFFVMYSIIISILTIILSIFILIIYYGYYTYYYYKYKNNNYNFVKLRINK